MKIVVKRKIIYIVLILFVVMGVFSFFIKEEYVFSSYKKIKIVLDAGHGGIDAGTTGVLTGVKESELNLIIVKELEKLFSGSGFKVILTRTDSEGLYGDTSSGFKLRDLKKRVEICNKSNASVMLSIHINKYSSPSRRGVQVFYKNTKESKRLATLLQNQINLMSESPKMYSALLGDYYILNSTCLSSVIVECGFLSNSEDEKLLLQDTYRKKLAKTIYSGVINYFSTK